MSIFFLVIALLVVAILLSRFTSWSKWGERRSVEHHEQAMEVLRSISSRGAASPSASSPRSSPGSGRWTIGRRS